MTLFLNRPSRRLRQSGQSMIEYTIICALLAVCLFAINSPAGKLLTDAIQDFYHDLTFFVSLP